MRLTEATEQGLVQYQITIKESSSPEISGVDLGVVGAVVQEIDGSVNVCVLLADVSPAVPIGVQLLWVVG